MKTKNNLASTMTRFITPNKIPPLSSCLGELKAEDEPYNVDPSPAPYPLPMNTRGTVAISKLSTRQSLSQLPFMYLPHHIALLILESSISHIHCATSHLWTLANRNSYLGSARLRVMAESISWCSFDLEFLQICAGRTNGQQGNLEFQDISSS